MVAKIKGNSKPVGVGLRALKGGAAVVGVVVDEGEPRVVLSTFLATGAEGDRLSMEPYHAAAELKRDSHGRVSAQAAALVSEGRARQDELAAQGLSAIVRGLEASHFHPIVATLLVNRAGWVTDLLAYSASWPEHLPVAEGLAVRDAIRFAFKHCGLELAERDEKSLPALDSRLSALGATAGKPWRKEQKLACLAAWLAVTAAS